MGSFSSEPQTVHPELVKLPKEAGKRLGVTLARSARRHCPYCGGPNIFKSWFTLKDRCPTCGVLFAYEDGYFLGSYAVSLIIALLLGIGLVVWMLVSLDLSVLQMQIIGVVCAIGFPIFFYPYGLLLWMVWDLYFNPPGDFSKRDRI